MTPLPSSKRRPPGGDAHAAGFDRTLDLFIASLDIERGLSRNTTDAYRSDCRLFFASLPPESAGAPGQVRERDVFEFLVAERQRGQCVVSIRRRLSAVRMYFRFLVARGFITDDPTEHLDSPRVGQRLPRYLTVDQIERLMAEITPAASRFPLRDRALLELLYATGLRVGEAVQLPLDGVRADLGVVRCFGKGARERIVPISRRAEAAVALYVEEERPRLAAVAGGSTKCEKMFLSRSGRPLGREVVRALLRKYAALAGLPSDVSPHVLRHSLATHLIRGGADLRIVQEILGHVRVETTEIYTHLDRTDLKNAHREFHPRG